MALRHYGYGLVSTTPFAERNTMSFGLYAAGFAIMICGLIYGAHLLHVPTHWIAVFAIVLVGAGILSGVKNTRPKDPA